METQTTATMERVERSDDIRMACGREEANRDAVTSLTHEAPVLVTPPLAVKRTVTTTGARISADIKMEVEEQTWEEHDKKKIGGRPEEVNAEGGRDEPQWATVIRKDRFNELEAMADGDESLNSGAPRQATTSTKGTGTVEKGQSEVGLSGVTLVRPKLEMLDAEREKVLEICSGNGASAVVKEEQLPEYVCSKKETVVDNVQPLTIVKSAEAMSYDEFLQSKHHTFQERKLCQLPKAEIRVKEEPYSRIQSIPYAKEVSKPVHHIQITHQSQMVESQQGFNQRQRKAEEDKSFNTVVLDTMEFPEEPDWLLVGRTTIIGLSTTKGSKLVNNEIVYFTFPSIDSKTKSIFRGVSSKAAAAVSGIVRFSTKRYGEIGRLPMEWAKCLIPLVNSSKVKVLCRCVAAPPCLQLMQEIWLYASFYIHKSVFTEGDKSSWRLDAPQNIDSTVSPLPSLFNFLKMSPLRKAEFTPEELNSRKRSLNIEDMTDEATMLGVAKRRKGCGTENDKSEQAITESSLNKLIGAADVYNLEEMEPPSKLTCDLRPYQKQALYWMKESEKGIDVEKATQTLHPCWAEYRICDERASSIYINMFSGEATTQLPAATQMARGGILADAMGLGKTVMTIALILTKPGGGIPDCQEAGKNSEVITKRTNESRSRSFSKVTGGTLIVCPMALLGQWKDELETHSETDSISIFVHYGGYRTTDPAVLSHHNVVLTTYGVLTAAYKSDGDGSIFHQVEWYRVVLDEAHIIKSSKTMGAQATYKLSSHCRWCLTGTPLQNNLEDLYSLLCFLHVEPWSNWAWWQKMIQRPYENGDPRGLRLLKAILRPLMLRRTKETKDKEGKPILVLPPTDIQVIKCEQTEAERDFYDALFKRSKVQFDQFVAQGKVLHNYASILELLLRLRQCCNHPFLVMSRADSQKYADLTKLSRRFLETNVDTPNPDSKLPNQAFIEEVIEGIRCGENTECPICLETADDAVLTPCAHRMCRECLLSSWKSHTAGFCPICRQVLRKTELITCPSENKFRVDINKNWKESSKVSKLLDCLECIQSSRSGEKSIIFSQWTSFLDLLEIPLRRKGIRFLRFDGSQSQKVRVTVLKEFNGDSDKTVLLMSLKAGGVGLNLTAASNVFLMDPWWNPAVEEQAIMRIHRIGQKRTVCVRRFIVKDTVEERMQQVQARKQQMIAGALTDQEVRSARIEELKMLFR
uniref:Uncharacterized protein n=1 Tax=Kalanchoe fedtschenkoi TaxID=63787 RepID=A0A7N0T786_KALFE